MEGSSQSAECKGSGFVALIIMLATCINNYLWMGLNLEKYSVFDLVMYMLPAIIYAAVLSFNYYVVGFQTIFKSIVPYTDGGFGFSPSEFGRDLFLTGVFLLVNIWPTYIVAFAENASGVALSDSYFSHFWKMSLFYILAWFYFVAWVNTTFFTASFVYGSCGIIFYVLSKIFDMAVTVTSDAESWFSRGTSFVIVFVLGILGFIFFIRVCIYVLERMGRAGSIR